jgi:superfamily II DNA or RNA helicase
MLMPITDGGDFRPTFATNRPEAGETVAHALNALLAGMRTHLAVPPPISIATAFFNPGGFNLLAAELEKCGPVRLLLGAEPEIDDGRLVRPLAAGRGRQAERQQLRRALEGHTRDLQADRDVVGFTRETDAGARRLVAWLREHGVEVRRFTGGFLHGKAFIVSTALPHVMSGSSNFTYAGLAANRELNLGQFDPGTVGAVREWFEELWSASEPYDLAALYESRWAPHLPWHVFLRMLWELYGSEIEEEAAGRSFTQLGLTSFQADGVWRAKRILSRRNGVIVADEVGLGKTFIAGELIYEASVTRRQKVLVIAPATLRDSTWLPFLRDMNLRADVVSYEQLAGDIAIAGRTDAALQHPDEYAMVVVDEAHALRNAITRRADALRELLAGSAPKDLVLLTATPVNNSLYDLHTLISYFIPNDAAFADTGVPSLRGYFDRAMAINPDDLSPEYLFDVIDQVAVRRTRRFVKHHYVGDKVVINGVEQEIRFPTPRVLKMTYDLEQALPGMFGMLATALGAEALEEGHDAAVVLLDAPGEVLSLARYVPSRFRLGDETEEQYERQNAGLLRSALLKRFESSAYAFRRTVEKMITSHDQFLSALDQGAVLTGDALREWSASDATDIDEFLGSYAAHDGDTDNVRDAREYRVHQLRAAVVADRDLLQQLHNSVRVLAWDEDPKVIALTDALAEIAADADHEGITEQQVRDKRKVLIFSYFADTVGHLATQVRAAVEADDRLAVYRDRIATASGPDKQGRAETLAGFAPRTAGGQGAEDKYDLLIATDVLSEGVNLQQARHIVNYDLPWNPMRLVQRHGRIDRIGSDHAEVFIRCYFPDQHLEALLGLEERLQRKLKQAAAAVGVGQVLPGFAGQEVTFTEARDEIARLRREDASLFEETGPSALSGEEYRRTLEQALKNPISRTTVLDLPWSAGTGFVRPGAQQPGMVFCARIADHPKPWFRYIPLTHNLRPQTDDDGEPIVIDDTLTCLSQADPGGPDTVSIFEAGLTAQLCYDAAFDAWALAKDHIHKGWMYNADPANLSRPVPKIMRDAADVVRAHGTHLGDRQDILVSRLEAPYAPRIQRAIRDLLNDQSLSGRQMADRLLSLAGHLGLVQQPAPQPLPQIESDDIHLISWTVILPDPLARNEVDAEDEALVPSQPVVVHQRDESFPSRRFEVGEILHGPARTIPVIVSAASETLPVSVYLSDEENHEQVIAAVEDLLATAGLVVEQRDEPVIGSWFLKMRATAKQAVMSPVAREAALTAVHAADTRLVLAQDAQVTSTLMQNLGPVLASLAHTKDAVLRIGALLIVKNDWTVQVIQLTAAQQATLDHRPQLSSSPRKILAALELSAENHPAPGRAAICEETPVAPRDPLGPATSAFG